VSEAPDKFFDVTTDEMIAELCRRHVAIVIARVPKSNEPVSFSTAGSYLFTRSLSEELCEFILENNPRHQQQEEET
jgi:hypothetical protein